MEDFPLSLRTTSVKVLEIFSNIGSVYGNQGEGGTKTELSRKGGDKKNVPEDSRRGKGKGGSLPWLWLLEIQEPENLALEQDAQKVKNPDDVPA